MNNERTVRAYEGGTGNHVFSRSLAQCEGQWNEGEVRPGTFDQLLSQQLEIAVNQGRTVVNVLDLGSGSGAIIKNIVQDGGIVESSRMKASRAILLDHPELTVNILGLTDAVTHDEFLQRDPIRANSSFSIPSPTDKQINAENVKYTITDEQRVTKFLKEVGVDNIDLLISTSFFLHLSTEMFCQVMADVVAALRPAGGTMVASGYHSFLKEYFEWHDKEIERAKATNDIERILDLKHDRYHVEDGDESEYIDDTIIDQKEELFANLNAQYDGALDIDYDHAVVVAKRVK